MIENFLEVNVHYTSMPLWCMFQNPPSESEPLKVPSAFVELDITLYAPDLGCVTPVSPMGEYLVVPGGLKAQNANRLIISANGEQMCCLAFTTTTQTISHFSSHIGNNATMYWTTTDSKNGSINKCCFVMLADSSYALHITFTAFGNSYTRTFRIVAGATN